MKILHVIDSSGLYGAEIMLLNLMVEQKLMGLTPILLSLGNITEGKKRIEQECEEKGLLVKKLRIGKKSGLIRSIKKLALLTEVLGIDLFHSHGYKGNILLGVLPKRLRKLPVVSTLHGWTATKRLSKIWFYEKLEQYFLPKLDALVLVTKGRYGERNTIKYNDKRSNKIFVIENGIPVLSFEDDSNFLNKLLPGNKGFVIGSIGRLSPEKGYEYLINALALLQAKSDDYKLVIIGEGKQRIHLEKMIQEKGLTEKVFLVGYHEDGYKLIKHFNVFVLSSLTEGLPITLLETMQAGVPIVATRVGGIPEVIKDKQNGLLVEAKNTDSLANAVSLIRKDTSTAKYLSENAKHLALTKYSSQRMAEEYREVYQKVLTNY